MLTILGVSICGIVVGVLSGITGVGGLLIPSFMITLLGMEPHLAIGTSMASYLPPCISAIWTHLRRGNIAWPLVAPLTAAGLVFVFLGTELKAYSPGHVLNFLLAGLVIAVGAMAFRPRPGQEVLAHPTRDGWLTGPALRLGLLGSGVGVISGMTGAGGPVLIVPAMIAMGHAPLRAVATGMVYATLVSTAGTVGNLLHDSVDFPLAALCAGGQVAGVWVGLAVAHHVNATVLRNIVGWVCLLAGLGILARAVF